MKFGRVPVADAEGAILAHGVVGDGVNFKKGRTLSAADIDALIRAKIADVTVARLEPGDVPEDEAARRIGEAARGSHTTLSAAMTGRTNLYAAERGLALIDAARVDAINAIHESITIATLAPYELVERRQMLATVKIIPFAAPAPAVRQAAEVAKALTASTPKAARPALVSVAPFTPKKVALISTSIPGMKTSLLDKNRAVLASRVEALESTIAFETRCAHDTEPVRGAIHEALAANPDIVMIFGASATTDRADAVPAGIMAAGGAIDHFGMPVDPGNLLLLAHIGATPVIGLPGCARSPKVNGFDFVLQRLCADVPVTPADIKRMGVGGLLKEIPTRPQPRDIAPAKSPAAPRIAAVMLAAGKSTRMGERNKLLMPLHGVPMIARTAAAVAASATSQLIVVTGNDADAVKAALKDCSVKFVHNARYAEGMATSLKAGLAAAPTDADGVLVCLGDMPAVTASAIDKLIAAFNPTEGRAIIVPTFGAKRGNPVLFARAYVEEIMHLEGDAGARALLSAHAEAVYEVETDAGVLADADTPAAFAALEAELKAQ